MKRYRNLTCAVLSPLDFSPQSCGIQLLKLLRKYPLIEPTHIGNAEPVCQVYEGPSKTMGVWKDPFLWKNKKSKINGSVWFGHGNRHSCIYLHTNEKHCDKPELKAFLIQSCKLFRADFGYIHLMTDVEMNDKNIPYDCSYAIDVGISTNDLRKCIPNVCWAMVFGRPYRDLGIALNGINPGIGVENFVETDQTYIQVTGNLRDVDANYPEFEAQRKQIRNNIGADLFCNGKNAEKLRTPKFRFDNDFGNQ